MLFYPRINKTVKYIEKQVDMNTIDIMHAHCVFADGAIALKLKQKYNIDYILSVRADTKEYFKKMPHAVIQLKNIILNAKKVIFIAPNMIEEINKKLDENTKKILKEKTIVLPNGINDYWHKNAESKKYKKRDYLELVQVSEFIKRKKIDESINIIEYLNNNGVKSKLTLIGSGKYFDDIKQYVKNKHLENFVTFTGQINDIDKLKDIYKNSDIFIMPSLNETFGLVYIEAMTQGLPVIYKTGTGIDGFFNTKIGFGIGEFDYEEIKNNIIELINNYDTISLECVEQSKRFNWSNIANEITKLY